MQTRIRFHCFITTYIDIIFMAKSSPESPAQDGSGLDHVWPSALFRGDSLEKIDSPKRDAIGGSNLNPFKIGMQPHLSPNVTEPSSKSWFPSPGHEHHSGQRDVSHEDTLINEGDYDPIRAYGPPMARKRTASAYKEDIRQTVDEKYVGMCTNHYQSIPSPLFSPPVVRKENIPPTALRPFRQGVIESAMSFDSHDSTNSGRSTSSALSPLPQCNFHLGIGSEKGFPARVGQYSFSRSPIQEFSYRASGSPYGENNDDASSCVTKIRRLNLDQGKAEYQWMYNGTQQNEERMNTYELQKRGQSTDCSPKDVAGFFATYSNPPPPLASAFESPPVLGRKGIDILTFPRSTDRETPALKRKACRSPFLSHDANTEISTASKEVTSRLMQDFETIGTLGSGCFGTVYKCISRVDGCPYAVKATKYQAKGRVDRDRMLKEVYALAALSDLTDTAAFHIVGYHQAWMEENRLYIQTELCTSTLLEEMKNGGTISHDTSRQFKVLREMLLALDLIHRNGMVHLDIKPENIFVKNDQFKLGDFGLVAKSSVHGDVEEGDSRYMCNDLLQGNHDDLTKVNICSLFSCGHLFTSRISLTFSYNPFFYLQT